MREIYKQKVKARFPEKPVRADELDQFRRTLNFFGLKESDIYEKDQQVKQEA